MKQTTTRWKSIRGTAAVEMAIILPVLVVISLGAVDLGRLFYDGVNVANAARAGLSYGSLSETKSQNTTQITALANNDGAANGGVNVTVTRVCECAGGSVVNCESGTCSGNPPRVYVKVSTSKTYNTLLPYPGIPNTVSLSRDSYMRAR